MFKRLIYTGILVVLALAGSSQVTIVLEEWPDTEGRDVYLAGNINMWQPGIPEFALREEGDRLVLVLPTFPVEAIEWKFTLGSWETEELQADGSVIPNRVHPWQAGDTVFCKVGRWRDGDPGKLPPLNANIRYHEVEAPFMSATRTLRVYVPKGYDEDTMAYPVVYMCDGQNLFDVATSYAGEWGIDESLDNLPADQQAIVVGIDHAGERRIDEYSPWAHPEYGGGWGEAWVNWVVDSVKHLIDQTYRTRPERNTTFIGGSSVGGLIASYAVVERNDVFGGAMVFSPSYWFAAESFDHITDNPITEPTGIYLACGGNEGMDMLGNIMVAYGLFNEEKAPGKRIRLNIESDASHNEGFWRLEWPRAIKWLMEGC